MLDQVLEECLVELPLFGNSSMKGFRKVSEPFRYIDDAIDGGAQDIVGPIYAGSDGTEYLAQVPEYSRDGTTTIIDLPRSRVFKVTRPNKTTQLREMTRSDAPQSVRDALLAVVGQSYEGKKNYQVLSLQ
jgi:hypothetical protein